MEASRRSFPGDSDVKVIRADEVQSALVDALADLFHVTGHGVGVLEAVAEAMPVAERHYRNEASGADGRAIEVIRDGVPARKRHVRVPQERYLEFLRERGEWVGIRRIAEHFDVHPGTAKRWLDGLVAQGKVVRVSIGQNAEYIDAEVV